MGFEIQNYPHLLNTALVSNPQNHTSFQEMLLQATENNCDAFISPIFSDAYAQNSGEGLNLDNCYIPSDEHLKKYQLNIITPFINQCVWKLPIQARVEFLNMVLGYSTYLNLRYFAIKLTQPDYQSVVATLMDKKVSQQLRKCVPNLVLIIETSGDVDENAKEDDRIWKQYIQFRQKLDEIGFPLGIQLALQIKANSPINRILNRWKSEKIAYLIMPTTCFTENAKGFVILPAKHERITIQILVLRGLFSLKIQSTQNQEQSKSAQEYFKYVLFVFRKFAQNKLRSDKQAINLQDFLQNPLQPYADNLESATYEVFENDQQKYDEYQGALQEAFETFPKTKKIIVYYIGSGRGGLLFNVFAAAKKTQRKVFVYAIEKNVYPIQTIKKRLRENKWENNVKIVHTDIRNYEMPEAPDVFLSELLGGFGDNELSPECLYWAEKNVLPQTICIPADYVSYIKPVSYQYIHRKIEPRARQIYYTVNYGSYYTCFQSKQVWKFNHPIRQPKSEEKQISEEQAFCRYSQTTFASKQDIVINGFAGYFTSCLYKQCELSILPERPTLGMYSWFPLFFCFEKPEFLRKGQEIGIELWRKNTAKKVWYEWRYSIGERTSLVHNKDGSSIAIDI